MTKPIPLPEELKYIDTSKWQDSSDPIERMAYWINWLSPHNLWKSKSALQEMLAQAQQEAVSAERARLAEQVEGMRLKTHETEALRRQLYGYNQALDDVLELLKKDL